LRAYALHAEELAVMRERTRVAREIHDTLAQGLAAIKMHLETGSAFLHEPELARKHMERARDLAGEYLNEARNSILELRSDALDGQVLPGALAALVTSWRAAHGTEGTPGDITYRVSGVDQQAPFWLSVPPAVELACYRIAQEALSNTTKHSQARHVEIELSKEGSELCLTITDDGLGFDPASIDGGPENRGFGIVGMRERMKLLHGRFEIISAPGAGTQVVAMIPLDMKGKSTEPVTKA